MSVVPEDRPIETLRKEVIDQLVMNYSHGELSLEAFERRLDDAMETSDHQVLVELTADLDLKVDQDFVDNKNEQMGINYVPGDSKDIEYIFKIFSGEERKGAWRLPKEIQVTSIFSGVDIDLTEAQFSNPEVLITVYNIFSGLDIFVPENINVQTRVFSIFGGTSNNTSSIADPNAPTVIVEGFALFSGINIKIKRTLKEHFIIFADMLKAMLS
ncbi:MAG: DUF1707 and DUF2154 domain-containing protein [Gammaproteobacteria bacterium]|nr:DUF1707 and DUF2154 domain-containing protein [Gammaproteobacteria bacterium]